MLKAGFYEKNITPPLGGHIPGFCLPRVADDVLADLFARAVVIDNGKEKVAMLALDMLGLDKHISGGIIDRVNEFTGIKKENILVCATHLHTGAPIRELAFLKPDKAYVEMMIRLAADSVTLANKRLKPVTAKYAKGYVDSISFVRNYNMKDGTVQTNPGRKNPDIVSPCTEIDPDVPVLAFYDMADKPIGAIIAFACHQDCLTGDKTAYSTDFAGIMDKELKKEYGSEFISVFFEGTCGNINHYDVNADEDEDLEHHRKMGRILATEIKSVLPKAKEIKDDEIKIKKEYITLKRKLFSNEELEKAKEFLKECEGKEFEFESLNPQSDFMRFHNAHNVISYMENKSKIRDVALCTLKIGDFILYAYPGEIFVQFGKEIKKNAPSEKNMVVELAYEAIGYIPTKDLFMPTVYESNLPACMFEPESGDEMTEKLINMGKEIMC